MLQLVKQKVEWTKDFYSS